MKIFSFLEKNKIATKEILEILGATIVFGFLSWFLFKNNCFGSAWGFMIMVFAGILNLYVIFFNDFSMPVLEKNHRKFMIMKRRNYPRKISMLNKKTKLSWLCDRFWISGCAYSVGDFVLLIGVFYATLHFGEILWRWFIKI